MVKIIAEAGVNHGGNMGRAFQLCDAAKEAGADIVKFQTWERGTVPEALEPLRLTQATFIRVARYCERIGIEFCSTPDDLDSLKFLVEQCGVKRVKLGSGSLLYRPLVDAAFATELPVILSTGMASYGEVAAAARSRPINSELTLLHCVSLYPCPDRLANMGRMTSLKRIEQHVGYSDHTIGAWSAMLAVALGAVIIEKHLCLAPTDTDAPVSLNPNGFRDYVTLVRHAVDLMGDGLYGPSPDEAAMIPRIRKTVDGLQPGL